MEEMEFSPLGLLRRAGMLLGWLVRIARRAERRNNINLESAEKSAGLYNWLAPSCSTPFISTMGRWLIALLVLTVRG